MRYSNHIGEEMLYDFSSMFCADPDNLVFAEKVSDDAWTFYQITNLKLLEKFECEPERLIKSYNEDISTRQELCHSYSVESFTVDLSHESAETIAKYKSIFVEDSPNDWKFLSCERIFHEDAIDGITRNVLKQDPHYYE